TREWRKTVPYSFVALAPLLRENPASCLHRDRTNVARRRKRFPLPGDILFRRSPGKAPAMHSQCRQLRVKIQSNGAAWENRVIPRSNRQRTYPPLAAGCPPGAWRNSSATHHSKCLEESPAPRYFRQRRRSYQTLALAASHGLTCAASPLPAQATFLHTE